METIITKFKNPVALYLLTSFTAFFPCLVLGYAYFDDDLLNYDGIARQFLKNCLTQGHLPLWNPYLFAGQPFWADPGAMATYPPLYLTLCFPIAYGFGVFYFLHLIWGAVGMHRWLKSLNLSKESCWVGSFAFSLSGFFWGEIIHPQCLAVFAWTPWLVGSLEKLSQDRKPSSAFSAGLAFAMIFLAGYFQMALALFYVAVPYFVFRRWSNSKISGTKSHDWTKNSVPWFFILWGSLPLLILAIPFYEFMQFSDRLHANLKYENFNADISLNPRHLPQFLFPINPINTPQDNLLPYEDYVSNAGYLGIWAPFFIFLAFQRKRKGWVLLAVLAIFLTLLVCFGKYFPLHRWLCLWVPGLALFRSPFRLVFIYTLFTSALTAFGFEFLLTQKKIPKNHQVPIRLWATVYAIIIFMALFLVGKQAWVQVVFLLAGWTGFYLWFQKNDSKNWGKIILIASIFLSLLVSGWIFCPSRLGPASNFDYEQKSSLLFEARNKVGLGRVFVGDHIPYPIESLRGALPGDYPTNASCLLGLRNVGGNNSLSLMKRGQLHTLPFDSFIHLMAVQGFLTGNEKGAVPGFTRQVAGSVKFYEAKERMKFVYAPAKIEIIPGDREQLKAMGQKDFNPYREAYLNEIPPPEVVQKLNAKPRRLDYELIQEDLNAQTFKINLDAPSWVVFSEVNYPGWKAWVDETPTVILTSNYLFRGLFVLAGTHQVSFRFEPAWYPFLFFALGFWLLVTFLYWARTKMRPFSL